MIFLEISALRAPIMSNCFTDSQRLHVSKNILTNLLRLLAFGIEGLSNSLRHPGTDPATFPCDQSVKGLALPRVVLGPYKVTNWSRPVERGRIVSAPTAF